ncbi:MAG: hypothetical protein WCX65_07015 [bacterium]
MKNFAEKYDWTLSLHSDIYPLESIQLATCGFLDDAFFYLYQPENGDTGKISVAVKIRDPKKTDSDVLSGKFANELNRQSLRLALSKMNRKVRAQIVGRALTSAVPAPEEQPAEKASPAIASEEEIKN